MESGQTVPSNGFVVGNKVYDVLKFVVMLFLPALATLYFALGTFWSLPNVEQVVGSIAAIAAFLGALTGLSAKTYNEAKYAGAIEMTTNELNQKVYSFNVQSDPHEWADKKEVVFKVDSRS